jgi:gliding motility-associated-like protein
MSRLRYLLLFILVITFYSVHAQQDMDLHLSDTFLPGKNVLKVKRDFLDPYLWVLTQGNGVYRINSITGDVADYSSQFTGYSNFNFIDIASDSKDAVFVATNSSNVLKYTGSGIEVIGNSKGLTGDINSIGFNYTQSVFSQGSGTGDIGKDELMIATTDGLYPYSKKNGTVRRVNMVKTDMRLFESTYRSLMFTDVITSNTYPDNAKYYEVANFYTSSFEYTGYIWLEGDKFGKTLKSAYYGNAGIFDAYNQRFPYTGNQFWSTENGLFQNRWSGSNTTNSPYNHYLNGVNINKITSIFGLINVKSLTQENYLLGTDQGLYFSNSNNKTQDNLFDYSFQHYDGLGNKVINDICVNATSYASPICEDGVWVAAQDGLYLLKPDYGAYIDQTQQLKGIYIDGQDPSLNEFQVCGNIILSARLTYSNYVGGLAQWYKDGIEIPNESKDKYTITSAGDYYAILYDPCSALHFESNHIKVTQNAAPAFTFNYPDVLNYCAGSAASLKTDDKPAYQYRWYKDGVLNGNKTATLDNITETGKYKVEVSACAGNWIPSKEVQVNFITLPKPNVSADKTSYCDGDVATLSAAVPIDGSQIINWTIYQYKLYKDGAPISGTGSSIKVNQTGKYKVEVTGCSGPVLSDEVQVIFDKLVQPILVADKAAYCIGDNAKLSINTSIDPLYTITWFRDGNLLRTELGKTSITTNLPGNYTVNITNSTTTCKILSAAYPLSFTPPPTISIQQIVNTTLCDGQTVDLKATYSSGNIRWTTGATTDKISVKNSGTYKATIATVAGCEVTESVTVQFLPNPSLNVPSATLCQFTKESITLTAPDGFVKYEWNGQAGNTTFSTDKLGPVNLTVTDNNGCKATQTINISSHCDDIHIPNTFSPNGDGHNDNWVIAGLEGDLSTTVKVYNRLGSLVFQSKGYASPWNGTFSGKKLPAAVYYYVISTQEAKQVLSGWVTILY